MEFAKPLPFREALAAKRVRTLLPTSARTAQFARIVEEGGAAVLERARFSAGVRSVQHLDVIDTGIDGLVDGTTDLATQRLAVKQFLRGTGYVAPVGEQGTLTDFSSDARINLQLTIGTQQAQGYGYWKQGQDPAVLDAFPAQEFVRVEAREAERQDWPARFEAAGGRIINGRMVALKNDPCWTKLSRFGTPYEPFDFGSGMGLRDISRRDAMALGLIDRDTELLPQDRPFNSDLQASPAVRSERLRSLLESTGLGSFDAAGVFHFTAPSGT